jgi:hypothetical protein
VTFLTEVSDLPLMTTTFGRLGGSRPFALTREIQAGSQAKLIYDGSTDPTTKSFTATDLITDQSYGFKVVPVNVVGDGIPTLSSTIVVARAGASASHTTLTGSSLSQGVAGVVYERQALFVEGNGALSGSFKLQIGTNGAQSGDIAYNADEATLAAALKGLQYFDTDRVIHLQGITYTTVGDEADSTQTTNKTVGDLQVTRMSTPTAGKTGYRWIITFSAYADRGDVPLIVATVGTVDDGGGTATVTVQEWVEGQANTFTIEPKKSIWCRCQRCRCCVWFCWRRCLFHRIVGFFSGAN